VLNFAIPSPDAAFEKCEIPPCTDVPVAFPDTALCLWDASKTLFSSKFPEREREILSRLNVKLGEGLL